MMRKPNSHRFTRRDFLKLGGTLLAGGTVAGAARHIGRVMAAPAAAPVASVPSGLPAAPQAAPAVQGVVRNIRLAATDGYILLPGRAEPLYVFGFVDADPNASINQVIGQLKGEVQAPIIAVDQEDDVYITLTNLGLVIRPDLDDSHTIHWHGFRNPVTLFDGVPEVSISVPVARNFPYFFRPHDPGTYMYHCHFEDVEHVQMGMNGIVFVRPAQNAGTGSLPPGKYVYNDGDGSTAYEREYTLLLNEIDTRPHDGLEAVQEFVWSGYKPNYWLINGRAYPDTIKLNADPSLPHQPISSLIQANKGEQILLRFANLGYEQHAMQLAGIPIHVVGEDASFLRGPSGHDISYWTHTIYIGPGEARDVLFTAPAFDPSAPVTTDALGSYNTYLLKNRNYFKQTNGGLPGLGGMVTAVWVYQGAPLPTQTAPNEVFA